MKFRIIKVSNGVDSPIYGIDKKYWIRMDSNDGIWFRNRFEI